MLQLEKERKNRTRRTSFEQKAEKCQKEKKRMGGKMEITATEKSEKDEWQNISSFFLQSLRLAVLNDVTDSCFPPFGVSFHDKSAQGGT